MRCTTAGKPHRRSAGSGAALTQSPEATMGWLNYHHLLYFWTVASEGSIARACRKLFLTQPTISAQIRDLEKAVGEPLFERTGRKLVLTERGQLVYRYASEIFGLGQELMDALKGGSAAQPGPLVVGLTSTLPKLVAYRLLAPTLKKAAPIQVVCLEDKLERLLAEMAACRVDLVLADAPAGRLTDRPVYNHLLGECGVAVFGAMRLARVYRRAFPSCLDGAPFLLPATNSPLRQSLEQWFAGHTIRPEVTGEFEDPTLLWIFGQGGWGLFALPLAIEDEVRRLTKVRRIGPVESVRQRYYAISVDRKRQHPAVAAITAAGKKLIN
jgi:LysR family transcriptional regulator, transcriptional activator of nhaA